MNGEGSPDTVMATGWGCGAANGATKMCLPPSLRDAETKGDDSAMGHEKFAWDCEARFAELYAQGELDESESGLAPKDGTPYDFVLPASGLVSNHGGVSDFISWTADGFICSKIPTSADVLHLEIHLGAPQGTLCKAYFKSNQTSDSLAEHSFEPMVRYRALREKLPRGFKSVAHLEVLRTSDPTYGSLAPSDRPNRSELTYEPLRRFGALHERLPRGAKSACHLEVLRTSDPTYGSLAPSDRPNSAELTYDPLRRFRLLARSSGERLPRGFKSVAHLEILRTSDPTYGTLMPRRLQGRYNALPKVSSLKELVSLEGLLAPMQRNGSWQCLDAVAPEAPAGPAAATFGTAFGTAAVGGLVLSGLPDVDWPEEVSDDECEESLPQLGGWQLRSARQRRERRSSRDQPRDSDQASLAITHERASERCSNDTIASYLEDSCDGAASGDWSAAAAGFAAKKGTPKKQAAAPSQGNPHFAPSAFWLPQQ